MTQRVKLILVVNYDEPHKHIEIDLVDSTGRDSIVALHHPLYRAPGLGDAVRSWTQVIRLAPDIPPGRYRVRIHGEKDYSEGNRREIAFEYEGGELELSITGVPHLGYFLDQQFVPVYPLIDLLLLSIAGKDAQRARGMVETFGPRFIDEFPPILRGPIGEDAMREPPPGDARLFVVGLPNWLSVDEPGTFIEDVTRHLRDAGLRATPAVITRIKPPVVEGITNELVVRFHESVPRKLAIHIAIEHGLELVRQLGSSDNTYLLRSSKALNYHLLKTGLRLLEDARVEEVEPQLIHQIHLDQYTPNDPLWSKQDCLQLIGCEDAWEALGNVDAKWRGGSPDVTLAILDGHGLDVNHPEFAGTVSNGQPKIVTAYDFQVMSAQSASSPGGSHGTQCAGSACAAFDNGEGISGVAPNCRLIAARLPTAFTHHDVADIIRWVAGIDPHRVDFPSLPSPAADVLSLSCWSTSLATVPSTIRRAIDEVTSKGRAGKGCVVVASTGNIGHLAFSSVRPLAARPDVVAVGASTRQNPTSPVDSYYPDTSPSQTRYGITVLPETRALYSPYGLEMDLVAPSSTCCKLSNKNEYEDPVLSAVEVGKGRTDGSSGGLGKFDYDETFGGTSHATPVVAGAAALILSADPDSTRKEVVDVLRETAEEIDFGNGDPVGQWQDLDMDGIKEFSRWYGHGRVNVKKAVERAARNASERAAWGGGS